MIWVVLILVLIVIALTGWVLILSVTIKEDRMWVMSRWSELSDKNRNTIDLWRTLQCEIKVQQNMIEELQHQRTL